MLFFINHFSLTLNITSLLKELEASEMAKKGKKKGKKKLFKVSKENTKVITEFIVLRRDKGKSKNTLYADRYVLEKFGYFLKNKQYKDATEKDLRTYMNTINFGSYNLQGITLIKFYRWLFDLDKDQIPKNMKWIEFKSKKNKNRIKDPDKKKLLITQEEYLKIQEECKSDIFGMWSALFETYWLSGGRLDEVRSMLIKDVIKVNQGDNIKIALRKSKTIAREVPLAEYPECLERWLGNHPKRDDPNEPLWISFKGETKGKQIKKITIQHKFYDIRDKTKIKKTLSIHSFRRTRATQMFHERSKDGGLIYSDKEMGQFFGWSLSTVSLRREEYDLYSQEDLEKLVFGRCESKTIETFDILKQKYEREKDRNQKKIAKMEKQMASMEETIRASVLAEIKDMVKGYTQ